MRYISKHGMADASTVRAEVHTFLAGLYNSVAENLPEDGSNEDDIVDVPASVFTVGQDPWIQLHEEDVNDAHAHFGGDEVRYLPPGSVHDLWKQFCASQAVKCSWYTFYDEFVKSFRHILKFRGYRQHAICSVCTRHKLFMKQFATDIVKRNQQARYFYEHIAAQQKDRQVLAQWRAKSKERGDMVLLEIDAVDQAKFAWPRSSAMASKDCNSTPRPRLHITACLVHGFFNILLLAEADRKKNSDFTCQVIAHVLTKLKAQGQGCAPEDLHLRINLDNTARENKNQQVFRFLGWLVATKKVKRCSVTFLRTGHTHEYIDQFLGRLCKYIWHHSELSTS